MKLFPFLLSFFKAHYAKPILGVFFAVTFFSAFFLGQRQAFAQLAPELVHYEQFRCLFEPLVNGKSEGCSHAATEAGVKSGQQSGIAYGKIPSGAQFVTDAGVKAVTMVVGLTMDANKAKVGMDGDRGTEYFWDRVADSGDGFIVRIGYIFPGTTIPAKYKVQRIGNQRDAIEANFSINPFSNVIPLINIDTVTSGGSQIKIPFYRENTLTGNDEVITNQVIQATIETPNGEVVPYGSKMTADFWYCGGIRDDGIGVNLDGRTTPKVTNTSVSGNSSGRVEYFTTRGTYTDDTGPKNDGFVDGVGEKCGGTAYYKIGETIEFTLPANKADAQAQQATTITTGVVASQSVTDDGNLPECGLLHIPGCAARVIYYVAYVPIQWVAGIFGRAFDFFLGYSISDESYRSSVIITGWKLVRDVSNIFFIIILVWTGLSTVFGFGGVSMKKVVPQLIINALLINFSLFGTQVIIDISNITARLFYNTMSVCDGECTYKVENGKRVIANPNTETTGGYKPLSTKIVASFNPQKIFNPAILNPNNAAGSNAQGSANLSKAYSEGIGSNNYAGYFIVVTLIAAFIMFGIAKMFFGVMFMFVGRVVGLYMAMIFAPFAVLTRGGMPLVGNIEAISWKKWLSDLTNYAMLAPIFVFFLYIIYAFINSDLVSTLKIGDEAGFMGTVLSIVLPMIIIYMLVNKGVSIAKKYAGDAGNMIQGIGTTVTGAALGIASGGLAFAGRNTVGRGLRAIGNGGKKTIMVDGKEVVETNAMRWANNAPNSRMARLMNNATNRAQTGSWDVRNGNKNAFSRFTSAFGIKDNVSSVVGLGADRGAGGVIGDNKRRAEARQKAFENEIQLSHLSDDDAAAAWKIYREKKIAAARASGAANWESQVDTDSTMTPHLDAEKKAKAEAKAAEEALAKAKEGTDQAAITAAELEFKRKTNLQELAQDKTNAERQILLKNIKEGRHSKDAIAKAAADKAVEEETKRLDKRGKVKNGKTYIDAIRGEYAENLSQSSFWMQDGKALNLKGAAVGLFGALLTTMGTTAFTAMGPLIAAQMANGLADNFTGARAKALKAMIDKATKGSGAASPLAKLQARVDEHEDRILKAVNEGLAESARHKSYGDIPEKEIEDGLIAREIALEQELEKLKNSIAANSNPTTQTDKEKLRDDRIAKKKAERAIKSLQSVVKDLEAASKNLNEFKEKEKTKEDKAKEDKKGK